MAVGYLDYLTNNGVIYFPYVRVEGIINTDGKPFSNWMTQVNTHNHDIKYAASSHQHSGYLKNIGPNDIRTTASYKDPLNIIADSGGTAEVKLYSTVLKDDVGKVRYKDGKMSLGINEGTWLNVQHDGVYFNNDKLATEKFVQLSMEAGGGGGSVDIDMLDDRYAANNHNHVADDITNMPTELPNPQKLIICVNGVKKIEYTGHAESTFDLSTDDLDLTIPNLGDLDGRYYRKYVAGTVLNTDITLNRTPEGATDPDVTYTKYITSNAYSYEYYAKDHSSDGDYEEGLPPTCKGIEETLYLVKTDTNKFIYKMSAIEDMDNGCKVYFSVGSNNAGAVISSNSLPLLVLSGGPTEKEAVINGNLRVKGSLHADSIVRHAPVTITLPLNGWVGSGPYTQTVNRPKELISEYPTLVKYMSTDLSEAEMLNYNVSFAAICGGSAEINTSSIIFRVLKKPTISITIGLAQ